MTVRDLKDYLSLNVVPDDALIEVLEDGAQGGHVDVIDVGYNYMPTQHGRVRCLVLRVPVTSLDKGFTQVLH